jgi:hypothetical protein
VTTGTRLLIKKIVKGCVEFVSPGRTARNLRVVNYPAPRLDSPSSRPSCITMHRRSTQRTRVFAADRVFRIAVVMASPSVVPAAQGPPPLTGKLAVGHGAGGERESRDAGCRRARGWVPGWPRGRQPGAWNPGRSVAGDGRADPRSSRGDLNVAVEQSCALSTVRRKRVRLPGGHAERYGRSGRTHAVPPLSPARIRASSL